MRRISSGLWAGAALLVSASAVQGAENYVINRFDLEDEGFQWVRWWGSAGQFYEWDSTVDAAGNAASGSLRATIDFDLATFGGDNQFAVRRDFGETLDGTQYTALQFQIRVDPTSPKQPSGAFGTLEYGLANSDFSQTALGSTTLAGDQAGWITITAPIDPALPKLDLVNGVFLKIWSGDPAQGVTGQTLLWWDDVTLIANTNTAPPPPPTVALVPASSGLQLTASQPGGQYQRQNIRTVDGAYGWVDAGGPVSYAVTIAQSPGAAGSGFQTHVFLVPAETAPTEASPDWNQPNVIFLAINQNNDGTAYAALRYKVNQANGNSMYFNADPEAGPVGSLGGVGAAQAEGTWTLTFATAATGTLTSPDGQTVEFTLPAEDAALFAGSLYAYFGTQPNSVANVGQSAVLSRVQVTGVPTPIDDNFAGVPQEDPELPSVLDPSLWQVVADDASGVVLVPEGASYWLSWTNPSTGYVPQRGTSLQGTWEDIAGPILGIGTRRALLLPAEAVPATGNSFYRVAQP